MCMVCQSNMAGKVFSLNTLLEFFASSTQIEKLRGERERGKSRFSFRPRRCRQTKQVFFLTKDFFFSRSTSRKKFGQIVFHDYFRTSRGKFMSHLILFPRRKRKQNVFLLYANLPASERMIDFSSQFNVRLEMRDAHPFPVSLPREYYSGRKFSVR